jgi:hypothetical protein
MFITESANWRSPQWGKAFSYYMKNGGEKGESLSFYCSELPPYLDCGAGATSDVFSVHARTCTVKKLALYVPYDLYDAFKP